MKKITTILFCMLGLTLFAQNNVFTQANEAYYKKDYKTAISKYESLVDQGLSSFELFYNLGTSYSQKGDLGKSILYFEKAKLIDPKNPLLTNNLAIANGKLKDEIESIAPFFLEAWWQDFYRLLSANIWSFLSLIFIWLGIFALAKWILSNRNAQKMLFYSFPLLLIGFLSFFAAKSATNFELNPRLGIVLAPETPLKSGADASSDDILTIHEGLKVDLVDQIGDWYKVHLKNGEIGWLKKDVVGKI